MHGLCLKQKEYDQLVTRRLNFTKLLSCTQNTIIFRVLLLINYILPLSYQHTHC